jgi:hypothetical protein
MTGMILHEASLDDFCQACRVMLGAKGSTTVPDKTVQATRYTSGCFRCYTDGTAK